MPTPPDPSPQALADAIRAVPGAANADAFMNITFVPVAECMNLPAARRLLGSSATVVLPDVCVFDPVARDRFMSAEGLADLENTFVTATTDWIDDQTLGRPTLMEMLRRSDPELPINRLSPSWEVVLTYQTAMTLVAIMNAADALDEATVKQAIRDYRGGSPMQYGPFDCGNVIPGIGTIQVPALCASYQGVWRFINGEWTAIADGTNGKLLGTQGIVDVDPNLLPAYGES